MFCSNLWVLPLRLSKPLYIPNPTVLTQLNAVLSIQRHHRQSLRSLNLVQYSLAISYVLTYHRHYSPLSGQRLLEESNLTQSTFLNPSLMLLLHITDSNRMDGKVASSENQHLSEFMSNHGALHDNPALGSTLYMSEQPYVKQVNYLRCAAELCLAPVQGYLMRSITYVYAPIYIIPTRPPVYRAPKIINLLQINNWSFRGPLSHTLISYHSCDSKDGEFIFAPRNCMND